LSLILAQTILVGAALYLALGGFFLVGVLLGRVGPTVGTELSRGARLLLAPGMVLVWPLLWRRRPGDRLPTESTAHRRSEARR